jgi:hypothetical protein
VANRRLLLCCAICFVVCVASAPVHADGAHADAHAEGARPQEREAAWVASAAHGLDPRAIETLTHLHGTARQLLALRAYLRAGDLLAERWSWTNEQIIAYPASEEGRAAAADIAAVERSFERANRGFGLRANQKPRSLEIQIARWNENREVGDVSAQLESALSRELGDAPDLDRVREAVKSWRPTIAAPLAAPGLSPHGQGRAFDFQVEHDGKVIAGCEVVTARRQWDEQGWTSKLHEAVVASGRAFGGPLQSPYEPWHYAYQPQIR